MCGHKNIEKAQLKELLQKKECWHLFIFFLVKLTPPGF